LEENDILKEVDLEKENNDNYDGNNTKNDGSKLLKTNSMNKYSNYSKEIKSVKKEDSAVDFQVEDIEEMKDENNNNYSLNLKSKSKNTEKTHQSKNTEKSHQSKNTEKSYHSKNTDKLHQSKNTDKLHQSIKPEEDLNQTNKSKNSLNKFVEPYQKNSSNKPLSEKNNDLTKNSKNDFKQTKNSSTKYDNSINLNDESKKKIRPLYEGKDSFKDKQQISSTKLINIPTACEIEEYDFLFIDLEEFINFQTKGLPLYELAEFIKKISKAENNPRIVINYPNILINMNILNLELLETILAIMTSTDIFLFEQKECLAFFNMLNQMNYEKDLPENKLIEYFFKEIPHQKSSVNKLGLFLDELQRFNIGEQRKDKIVNNLSYEINLFPKINHFNQKIVDEYKKIITINNSYFKSIFFGGYFSNFIFNEDHYTSYFSGAESTKRILEIFKNKIDFPINPEFYLMRLQKDRILKNQEKEKLKNKEEKFVLDCVNKTNSSIRYYNPLFDDNLNAFFASKVIRKQLQEKGFINTNGFVLYDSSYKALLGVPPKAKKRLDTSERERHLLLAIKQNRVIRHYRLFFLLNKFYKIFLHLRKYNILY